MYNRGNTRQFYRGGPGGPAPQMRRRFRGQFVRRRSPSGGYQGGSFSDDRNDSSPPPTNQMQHMNRPNYSNDYNPHYKGKKIDELKTEIEEMKDLFSKLTVELDQVKAKVKELEDSGLKVQPVSNNPVKEGDNIEQDDKDTRRKAKFLKQRAKKAAKLAEKRAASAQKINNENASNNSIANATSNKASEPANVVTVNQQPQTAAGGDRKERVNGGPVLNNKRRDNKSKKQLTKASRNSINDDSTTQAAEPSSEERVDGEGRDGVGRVKILRKKQYFQRRGYRPRRRRNESSERNSNDTSPQGEPSTVQDYFKKKRKNRRVFPELSEDDLQVLVQTLKRQFIKYEKSMEAIKSVMNEKGPAVVYEFCVGIFEHAMFDVTSPTKISEIASNLFHLLVSDDNTSEVDFQRGFYDALNSLSKRGDEIAIDAPRYLDTIGQILAECLILMHNKHKYLINKFVNKCLKAYCEESRANLLACIMKSIASNKNERFAKEIWNLAHLSWEKNMPKNSDLAEFLEAQEVVFTTKEFPPEPKGTRTSAKELEEFADEVTGMVEKQCTPKELDDLVKGLLLEKDEEVEYLSTLIYAIVRGCISSGSSEDYKLDTEALNKYSSLVVTQHSEHNDIALQALTALTKLWHEYNCPQDLMRSILNALHNKGAASYETLDRWLNSPNLANIPGIGAARLSSKRYIEDLGNSLKSHT